MMTKRKGLFALLSTCLVVLFGLALAGCGGDNGDENGQNTDVTYSVELYLQSLEGSDYVLSETRTGTAPSGEQLTLPAPELTGFVEVKTDSTVDTLNVSADAKTFRFYYDRCVYTVSYDKNASAGLVVDGTAEEVQLRYGAQFTAAAPFTAGEARLAGYAYTSDGEVELFPEESFTVQSNVTLYAVWNRALRNRTGGSDRLFVLAEAPGKVVLLRGGVEFEGSINEERVFVLNPPDGSTITGKAGATTFSYVSPAEANTYYLWEDAFEDLEYVGGINEDVTLVIDEYLEATFTSGDVTSTGTVTEAGTLIFELDDGWSTVSFTEYRYVNDEGNGFRFYLTEDEDGTPLFVRGGEEEGYCIGASRYFGVPFETGLDYELDGYGNMTIFYYSEPVFSSNYTVKAAYSAEVDGEIVNYFVITMLYPTNTGFALVEAYLEPYGVEDGQTVYLLSEPEIFAGKYNSLDDGRTLELDGYGIFPDSAVLKDAYGNVVYEGAYDVNESNVFGTFVSLPLEDGAYICELNVGRKNYTIYDVNGDTFASDGDEFTADEYMHVFIDAGGDFMLEPSYLVSFGRVDRGGTASGIYELNARGEYERTSRGVVSFMSWGDLYVYTYTSRDGDVVFDFMVQPVINPNTGEIVRAYVILEQNGERNYEVWHEENGDGEIWYNADLELFFYFPEGEDSTVAYDATGTYEVIGAQDDPLGGVWEITWVDYTLGVYDGCYLYVNSGAGGTTFTLTARDAYYLMDGGSLYDPTTPYVILDGVEDVAIYYDQATFVDDDFGGHYEPGWVRGTYTVENGVYTVTSDVINFSFVTGEFLHVEYSIGEVVSVIWKYDANFDDTFTAEGVEVELDGFHTGVAVVDGKRYEGEYYTETEGGGGIAPFDLEPSDENYLIHFTASDGETFLFRIEGTEFRMLDGVEGSYMIEWDGAYCTVEFDGNGDFVIYDKMGDEVTGGIYTITEKDPYIVRLFAEGGLTVDLAIGDREVTVYNELFDGVFIGWDWSVLHIDGYGQITYYPADGSPAVGGSLEFIDAENYYAELHLDDYSSVLLVLDPATERYTVQKFAADYLYFSADLAALAYEADGFVTYNGTTSAAFTEQDGVHVYAMNADWTGYEYAATLPVPGEATVTFGNTTYSLWSADRFAEPFELSGEIVFEDDTPSVEATLTFTLSNEWGSVSATNAIFSDYPATLSVGNEDYEVTILNFWSDYIYDYNGAWLNVNGVYTDIELNVAPNGEGTFVARGGEQQFSIVDGYDGTDSSIVRLYKGYGPYVVEELGYSGTLNFGDEMIQFDTENMPVEVAGDDSLWDLSFTSGGKDYVIRYQQSAGDTYFALYYLAETHALTATGYGVEAHVLVETGGAFTLAFEPGDVCNVLLDKEGAPVNAFRFRSFPKDGNASSGWLVEVGTYDEMTDKGELGTAYHFAFGYTDEGELESVEVTEHIFREALLDGEYLVQFLVNEEDSVDYFGSFAIYGEDEMGISGYFFERVLSAEKGDSDYVWTVVTESGTYTVTVAVGAEGKPELNGEGLWTIESVLESQDDDPVGPGVAL